MMPQTPACIVTDAQAPPISDASRTNGRGVAGTPTRFTAPSSIDDRPQPAHRDPKPTTAKRNRRWRYEFKYVVARHLRNPLLADLRPFLRADPFSGTDGSYSVHSLYLDSPCWQCFHDKSEGAAIRHKLRVRSYPAVGREARYKFEVKYRHNNRNSKDVTVVDAAAYRKILPALSGSRFVSPALLRQMPELRSFFYLKQLHAMSPAVTVAFRRVALTSRQDRRLRVTLDDSITGSRCRHLIQPSRQAVALLPPHVSILEIKLEHGMPFGLQRVISKYRLRLQSVSKYALAVSRLSLGVEGIS